MKFESIIQRYYNSYLTTTKDPMALGDFFQDFTKYVLTSYDSGEDFERIIVISHALYYAHSVYKRETALDINLFEDIHVKKLKKDFRAYKDSIEGEWLDPRRIEAYNSAIHSIPLVEYTRARTQEALEKLDDRLREKIEFFLKFRRISFGDMNFSLN